RSTRCSATVSARWAGRRWSNSPTRRSTTSSATAATAGPCSARPPPPPQPSWPTCSATPRDCCARASWSWWVRWPRRWRPSQVDRRGSAGCLQGRLAAIIQAMPILRLLLAIPLLAMLAWRPAAADPGGDPPAGPAPAAMARLVLEQRGGEVLAWAENLLAGPIEVMLRGDGAALPAARPALPARATVPARGRALVARLGPSVPREAGLNLQAVPGHPSVRTHEVEYAWPLSGLPARVTQGWGGGTSHRGPANLHAVDLAAPAGTPVLAARDGVVMQVESRFRHGAADPRLEDRANFVRILHGDGTMALYAHLDATGVF